VVIRVEDPLPLAEVHAQALQHLLQILPPAGTLLERGGFDLWADA